MKLTSKVAAFVAILGLAACGGAPDYGTITDKRYEERRLIPTMCGKVSCMMVDDEDWILTICNEKECGEEQVSEEYYNSVEIGDTWDVRG